MHRCIIACLSAIALLCACAEQPNQNRYDSRDVGMNAAVEFGVILSERSVQINGEDTGLGSVAGGVGGGVAGSLIGAGRGSVLGALGGAVAGLFLGDAIEKKNGDRAGVEYVIRFDSGSAQSIVQNIAKTDAPLAVNQRVMVQMQGSYRRVLPVAAGSVAGAAPAYAMPTPAGR